MAPGVREPGPVSCYLTQTKGQSGGFPGEAPASYLDQCLPLSLGEILSLAISFFPFLPDLE